MLNILSHIVKQQEYLVDIIKVILQEVKVYVFSLNVEENEAYLFFKIGFTY